MTDTACARGCSEGFTQPLNGGFDSRQAVHIEIVREVVVCAHRHIHCVWPEHHFWFRAGPGDPGDADEGDDEE